MRECGIDAAAVVAVGFVDDPAVGGMLCGVVMGDSAGAVGAAVVDDEHVKCFVNRQRFQATRKQGFHVVRGDDDRQHFLHFLQYSTAGSRPHSRGKAEDAGMASGSAG